MAWPQATEYSAVIQNPSACFADAELASGVPAPDMILGLPLTYAGNFASVFKLVCPGEQVWAIKCFTRPVTDLHERYQQISKHLQTNRKRFSVEFHYLTEGIQVDRAWYPVVKMRWIEGYTLNEFLREHADNPSLLEQLGQLWLRLAVEMREARMAHGDLQHGNVMLVPGRSASAMVLRLIDYDGMWVPGLAHAPPGEVGHPNYQHPDRPGQGGYHVEIDRFAHLVIFTALRALQTGGKALWERYDNGENLLFREADFREPGRSKLFADLLTLPDPHVQCLVGHLVGACLQPLAQTPLLVELVENSTVRPLSTEQIDSLRARIPFFRASRAVPPPLPAPDWLAEVVRLDQPSPLATATVQPLSMLDAHRAEETAIEAHQLTSTQLDQPVLSPRAVPEPPRSWPAPPEWFLQLGLSPDGLLSRCWPVTMGVALGVPLFTLVLMLFWPLASRPSGPPPSSITEHPRLFPVDPITIRAGRPAEVVVVIDRPKLVGKLLVQLFGLPAGVTCAVTEVPQGYGPVRLELKLVTTIDTPASAEKLTVQLYDGETRLHEQTTTLTVEPFRRPRLLDLTPMPIELAQGQTKRILARIDPQGNTDDWALRLQTDGQIVGLTQTATRKVALQSNQVGLELSATPGTSPVEGKIVKVVLLAAGIECDSRLVSLSIHPATRPIAIGLTAPILTTIQAGNTARLDVQLIRGDYPGRLTLRLLNAPMGVSADDSLVAAGENKGSLLLRAGPDAGRRLALHEVRIVALVEDRVVGETKARLRVEQRAPATRSVKPPGLPWPAPYEVKFKTGDGLTIVGTWYPSSLKKKAACVLMLHDLTPKASRTEEGWPALAQALQHKGFAVLTLDHRGFGTTAREELPGEFWNHRPNLRLKNYLGQKEGVSFVKLDHQQWLDHGVYLPWLVQDIVAARLWLDLKHDEGEVNSRGLFVIAAGQSAQLALLWMTTEAWRCQEHTVGFGNLPAEGRDLLGAIWLDLGSPTGPLFGNKAARKVLGATPLPPMLALINQDNPSARTSMQILSRTLTGAGNPGVEEKQFNRGGSPPMRLAQAPSAETMIIEYLSAQLKKADVPSWSLRDVEKHQYRWVLSPRKRFPAKQAGETNPQLVPLNEWGYPSLGLR
jgi:hypothetical protein